MTFLAPNPCHYWSNHKSEPQRVFLYIEVNRRKTGFRQASLGQTTKVNHRGTFCVSSTVSSDQGKTLRKILSNRGNREIEHEKRGKE